MRLKLILIVLPILLITSSCDVFNSNPDSDDTDILTLQSEISDNIRAKDVVQASGRIFILGQTYGENEDFYLAEIDQQGQL